MYLLPLLLMLPPPPDAETLAKYATPEPTFPAAAILHETECGKTIGIVPEQPVNTTVKTAYSSTGCFCAMCQGNGSSGYTSRTRCTNHPTPLAEIEDALQQIQLSKSDVLYDLGCGDGRVCVLAASIHGCRAVGLDKRPAAIELARDNASLNGSERLLRFYERDVFASNLEDATVVFVYLDKSLMGDVAEVLRRYPNITRAISYQHAWPSGGRKAGDFHIWTRRDRVATRPSARRGST